MIYKKAISFLLIFLILSNAFIPYINYAEEISIENITIEDNVNQKDKKVDVIKSKNENDLKIYSETACLMEQETGIVLYDKDMHRKMYPASTTKILTAIIVIESCDLDDRAEASYEAVDCLEEGYTKANIVPGEAFTVRQLLEVMLLQSANEAACVLAEHVSGSVEKFVELMNRKAKQLGCMDSNFVNPNGMHDDNHYSSAYDLALIQRYCMENSIYRDILVKKECELEDTEIWENYKIENELENEPYREFKNTNKMLKKGDKYYYPYCTGGKTGFTTPAKNCFIASSNKDNFKLVSVIMHAELTEDDKSARYVDTINLFNYGYDNFTKEDIIREYETKEIENNKLTEEQKEDIKVEKLLQKDFQSILDLIKNIKLDDFNSIVMLVVGLIVLIIGFLILKLNSKHRRKDSIYKFNLKK